MPTKNRTTRLSYVTEHILLRCDCRSTCGSSLRVLDSLNLAPGTHPSSECGLLVQLKELFHQRVLDDWCARIDRAWSSL